MPPTVFWIFMLWAGAAVAAPSGPMPQSASSSRCVGTELARILRKYAAGRKAGSEYVFTPEKRAQSYLQAGEQVDAIFGDHLLGYESSKRAILATLQDYREANRAVPRIQSSEIDQLGVNISEVMIHDGLFGEKWLDASSRDASKLPRLGSPARPLHVDVPMAFSRGILYFADTNDGRKILRPAILHIEPETLGAHFREQGRTGGNITVARRTLLASKLNDDLHLDLVPRSYLAQAHIEGHPEAHLVVVSDYAPGQPDAFWDKAAALRAPNLLSDAEAFEFLIGQADGNAGNIFVVLKEESPGRIKIDFSRGIKVVDHEYAFLSGLSWRGAQYLGLRLPARYNRDFVRRLAELTPEKMLKMYGDLASPAEIEGMIFRRDIILKDVELKKDQAFFAESGQ